MFGRYIPAMAALLVMGVTSVAHAQQATRDSLQRDRSRDDRAITRDTLKLQHDIAVRDSERAVLQHDQSSTSQDTQRIDSLKAELARLRKATPRDTAAISRDEALLKRRQQTLDTDLDRARREKKQADVAEKTVQHESQAAIKAHHDVREDHARSEKTKDSTVRR